LPAENLGQRPRETPDGRRGRADLQGSGFYITDYRSAGYKAAAKSESGGAESKTGDAKPAGDSKPAGDAKKTETKPAATEKSKPAKKKEN